LRECTLPLTGLKVVDTIVTEMADTKVTSSGLVLREIAPGLSPEDVQKATEASLNISPNLKQMAAWLLLHLEDMYFRAQAPPGIVATSCFLMCLPTLTSLHPSLRDRGHLVSRASMAS